MSSNDFFMRQIEGMTDMLSTVLFGKKASDNEEIVYESNISSSNHLLLIDLRFMVFQRELNEAENLLFKKMEMHPEICCFDIAMQFYSWLDDLSDEELKSHNYTREEIHEGRQAVKKFYETAK